MGGQRKPRQGRPASDADQGGVCRGRDGRTGEGQVNGQVNGQARGYDRLAGVPAITALPMQRSAFLVSGLIGWWLTGGWWSGFSFLRFFLRREAQCTERHLRVSHGGDSRRPSARASFPCPEDYRKSGQVTLEIILAGFGGGGILGLPQPTHRPSNTQNPQSIHQHP